MKLRRIYFRLAFPSQTCIAYWIGVLNPVGMTYTAVKLNYNLDLFVEVFQSVYTYLRNLVCTCCGHQASLDEMFSMLHYLKKCFHLKNANKVPWCNVDKIIAGNSLFSYSFSTGEGESEYVYHALSLDLAHAKKGMNTKTKWVKRK